MKLMLALHFMRWHCVRAGGLGVWVYEREGGTDGKPEREFVWMSILVSVVFQCLWSGCGTLCCLESRVRNVRSFIQSVSYVISFERVILAFAWLALFSPSILAKRAKYASLPSCFIKFKLTNKLTMIKHISFARHFKHTLCMQIFTPDNYNYKWWCYT